MPEYTFKFLGFSSASAQFLHSQGDFTEDYFEGSFKIEAEDFGKACEAFTVFAAKAAPIYTLLSCVRED